MNKMIKKSIATLFLMSFLVTNIFTQNNDYKTVADKMPEIKGGLNALYSKIVYPPIARQTKTEGKVFLLTYINEDGKVDKVEVVKGIGAGCDEAAINAVKTADFSPGMVNNQPVKVKMALSIVFKIQN